MKEAMQPIPESELILNPDGSIYHLHLLPEDISTTIINVGDPDRVCTVSSFFDKIEVKKQKREFITHTGTYKGKRLTVISTGIGTDNIDIVYNELDALVNIDLKTRTIKDKHTALNLIRIGTSGALQEDILPDSFVCSSHGLGLDGLMNYYFTDAASEDKDLNEAFADYLPNDCRFPRSPIVKASDFLFERISSQMNTGITASCAGFYGPQGRMLRLQPYRHDLLDKLTAFRFGNHRITNFEMETGAMYGLAKLLGHRCCSTNVIIANRIRHEFSGNPAKSVNELIAVVLDKIIKFI
ncbi:MAG: nucleoside phosphorylase [Bacteroidia bacterium]|nr:nucleoside phosphorylase [Bacteroidia bacterium]